MTKLAGALEEADGGAGIPFIRIDGSTDSRDRLLVGWVCSGTSYCPFLLQA
jgi:hypothetical protein